MIPLLLDTHVLIWLLGDADRISAVVHSEIQAAADRGQLIISAITPWEISLLVSKRQISFGMDVEIWINRALALPGIILEPLRPKIAIESTRLPWEMHGDPADRILVATALHLGAALVTADERLLKYGADGRLRCLAAA